MDGSEDVEFVGTLLEPSELGWVVHDHQQPQRSYTNHEHNKNKNKQKKKRKKRGKEGEERNLQPPRDCLS